MHGSSKKLITIWFTNKINNFVTLCQLRFAFSKNNELSNAEKNTSTVNGDKCHVRFWQKTKCRWIVDGWQRTTPNGVEREQKKHQRSEWNTCWKSKRQLNFVAGISIEWSHYRVIVNVCVLAKKIAQANKRGKAWRMWRTKLSEQTLFLAMEVLCQSDFDGYI